MSCRRNQALVIVWVGQWTLIVDEVVCVQASRNGLENAGHLFEVEKLREIATGACVRKVERSLSYAEIVFDEAQDGAEIHSIVVDICHRSVGGDDHEWDAKAILEVALSAGQESGRLVIVPGSPIVPRND